MESDDFALPALEYNHYKLRGNTAKKREILRALGNIVEPLLQDRNFKSGSYKQLVSNAGFMLNSFHIRHNNKEGRYAREYIVNLNDERLEKLYDYTYNTLLMVIIANEQTAIDAEIDTIKADPNW